MRPFGRNVIGRRWCGTHSVEHLRRLTIQVVPDKELLQATDHAALRTKRNRSALVRDALREHLRRLTIQAMEERDRAGYLERSPAGGKSGSLSDRSEAERSEPERREAEFWEAEAAWPKE